MSQKKKRIRDYARENAWEDTPAQVKRREARNAARRKAVKKYGKTALKGKEVDHSLSRGKGGLRVRKNLKTAKISIISRHANRVKQPKRKPR